MATNEGRNSFSKQQNKAQRITTQQQLIQGMLANIRIRTLCLSVYYLQYKYWKHVESLVFWLFYASVKPEFSHEKSRLCSRTGWSGRYFVLRAASETCIMRCFKICAPQQILLGWTWWVCPCIVDDMKRVNSTRCYTMVYWTLWIAQHVSGIIMPIIRSLRLYRWPQRVAPHLG